MTKPDLVNLAPAQCTTCRSAIPGAIRGEGAAPTIIDLDFEQDVLSETKRIDREMMPQMTGTLRFTRPANYGLTLVAWCATC